MAETIAKLVIKKTAIASAAPSLPFLEAGELAINYADGKLFYRDSSNVIQYIGVKSPASLLNNQTFIGNNSFSGDNTFVGINTFGAIGMTPIVLTDGAIAWDSTDGNLATVTLTQDSTLIDITNVTGGTYVLRVIQDAIGGHTLSFGTKFKSPEGALFEVSVLPNAISIITILNNGDDDKYLIGQLDFVSFGTALPAPAYPNQITVTEATGDGLWLNATYDRVPDQNGEVAYQLLDYSGAPLKLAVIAADGSSNYTLETFERADEFNPWVSTGVQFEIDAPALPWESGWTIAVGADVTGDAVINAEVSTAPYQLTVVASSDIGSIGQTFDLFVVPETTWYGTTPIPAGTMYRAVNPFYAVNSAAHLFMAPRNNDAGGEWGIGFMAEPGIDNGLFEFLEHADLLGPSGTYQDAGLGGPTFVVTIAAL